MTVKLKTLNNPESVTQRRCKLSRTGCSSYKCKFFKIHTY